MSTKSKTIWSIVLIVVALLLAAGYIKFYFVFSDGYQTGELNKFSKTGYVFKTYEGIMILSGYGNKSSNGQNNPQVQSNYFEFSVTDKEVADQLMHCTGRRVELHYKKYLGTLPWRGFQKHIVDHVSIVDEDGNIQSNHAPAESLFL